MGRKVKFPAVAQLKFHLPKRKVTSSQLINWKLLKKQEASILASNAFVLLVSDYFPFSIVNDIRNFVFGPAKAFVYGFCRNRKQKFIMSFTIKHNVQCLREQRELFFLISEIFQAQFTSPGGLYNGLTYEEIMSGHSKLRNRTIANIFNQMGLIEAWGTGIRRIKEAAKSYGLPIPEILVFDDMFRVNLYRNQISEMHDTQNKTSE